MQCNHWKDEWVAWIYDELEEAEARVVAEHLADCESCRATMDALQESRRMLRESAAPVPAAPHVVVLKPRTLHRPWAIAGGLLAAAAVFTLGLVTAPLLGAGDGGIDAELEARLASLERQSVESAAARQQALEASRNAVTYQELDDRVETALHEIDVNRARDFEFLLSEITAAEYRTGRDMRSQRDSLIQTMLASNPGFGEH